MLGLFKNKNSKENALTKSATVYISDKFKHLIIAPRHENYAGILYEQKDCFASDYPIDLTAFGEEVIKNLNLYSVKDSNRRDSKSSDWPAYKHSKCKTIVSFEKEYISIFIRSANDSNLILILEGRPFKNSELTVNSCISFYTDKENLGSRINEVYQACLIGKIF